MTDKGREGGREKDELYSQTEEGRQRGRERYRVEV